MSLLHRRLHRALLAGFSLGSAALLLPPAFGQPPGRPGDGGRGMFRMLPLVAALDVDGDGELSAAEIDDASNHLRSLDADGDGRLSQDELRPAGGPEGFAPGRPGRGEPGPGEGPREGPGGADMVERLMEFDADNDGMLSPTEVPERMRAIVNRADADHDGLASRDELTAAARSMAGRPAAGGRQGEGRREGGDHGPRGGGDPTAFLDRMFQFDTDGDGKLTRDELSAMRPPQGREGRREGGRREGGEPGRRPPVEE